MGKNKKSKNSKCNNDEVLTEEQYEEYLKDIYGMDFIAGFTESGIPYGIIKDEDNENDEIITREISVDSNDDLPF